MLMQSIYRTTYSIQIYNRNHRSVLVKGFNTFKHFSSITDVIDTKSSKDTGDILMTGLNGNQDISVKVVSCKGK